MRLRDGGKLQAQHSRAGLSCFAAPRPGIPPLRLRSGQALAQRARQDGAPVELDKGITWDNGRLTDRLVPANRLENVVGLATGALSESL